MKIKPIVTKYDIGQLVLVHAKRGITQTKIEEIYVEITKDSFEIWYRVEFNYERYNERHIMVTKKQVLRSVEEDLLQIPLLLE